MYTYRKWLSIIFILTICINCVDADKKEERYFTCKINGQPWSMVLTASGEKKEGHITTHYLFRNFTKTEIGTFSVLGIKYPKLEDLIEDTYYTEKRIFFAITDDACFKTMPLKWNLAFPPPCATSKFYDESYAQDEPENNTINGWAYDVSDFSNVIDGEFYLDSIRNQGVETNEAWGRFWFTASNNFGDTVKITEGRFHYVK